MRTSQKKSNWKRLQDGRLNWKLFKLRADILAAVRTFFRERHFLEIEAPLMTPYPTLDSNIRSVPVSYDTGQKEALPLYLHTSPEHAMKKLMAAGADRLAFIGKVFRDGEQTKMHNGEFTMVEWYRSRADYQDIIAETADLIRYIAKNIFNTTVLNYQGQTYDLSGKWTQSEVRQLFQTYADIDIAGPVEASKLKETAQQHAIPFMADDSWETLYFRLFLTLIEPRLGHTAPEFVIDYPTSMGLMARQKCNDAEWVERTELYIAGVELANGYSELTDPVEQLNRFKADAAIKKNECGLEYPIDHELIEALYDGLPPCAGMALGLDRLIMLFLDKTDIQDVLLFPIHQFMPGTT